MSLRLIYPKKERK